MLRRALKFGFLGGLALALTFIAWLVVKQVRLAEEESGGGERMASVTVEVMPVLQQTVHDIRMLAGTLQPRARSLVAPKISGRLEELHVNIGDLVERDEIIATLEGDEAVQSVEEARAELEVARANLAESRNALSIAEREFSRVNRLFDQGIASESELDASRAELDARRARVRVSESQVTQREAQLRAAEVRLSYTVIRATWSNSEGSRVVGERFVDEGSTLAANEPIVSILDIDRLTVVVFVAERDYARLRIGQPARIAGDSYPGESFEGRIVRLAPEFREASRQARVEIELDNPDHRLKPGMFVRAEVELDRAANANVIPIEAVVRRQGRTGVFVVNRESMTAHFVPIETGIREGGIVQVLEPVLNGEVVTLGQHLLDDGSAIRIAGDEQPQLTRSP